MKLMGRLHYNPESILEEEFMPSAQEVFNENVQGLPLAERLRLAKLILEDLTTSGSLDLDYSDAWSDEDLRDLASVSMQYADSQCGDEYAYSIEPR